MSRKKKYRGHYCWACDRIRANERFSGGGHNRHICRDCHKLGNEELAYRQLIRDVDRCLTFGGGIRRNQSKNFDRFLNHDNPRVRAYAQQAKQEIDADRRASIQAFEADERMSAESPETICQDFCDELENIEPEAELFI